jgi:ribosomal protein S18 acetylase RimI-like enzyme
MVYEMTESMATTVRQSRAAAARARAWRLSALTDFCDVVEPWEHGIVFRATRYPTYYDLNVVRVEETPAISAPELIALADRALDGLSHRLVEFADAADGKPLRPEFERRGWRSLRLAWMRHQSEPASGAPADAVEIRELPYDAVHELRVHWHHEDFPGSDPAAFHEQARDVALRRNARVFAALDAGDAVAFAQLERQARDAEISEVYVRRDRRDHGLGTAVTRAAVAAAGGARDLWISADDEGDAKRLYHRLGFRSVARSMQFLLLPS